MNYLLQIQSPPPDDLNFLSLLLKGGIIMIPITILSFITIYLFIERYLYLKTAIHRDRDFINQLIQYLKQSDIKSALQIASREKHATGYVLTNGLSVIGRPVHEIESVMESATQISIAEMEKNTGYLTIIAGVAPMLGFLGTILGIIRIFYSISITNDISIGSISGGLYEKMITSGAGLFVGAIAYTCYHLLQQKIDRFTLQIQKDVLEFMRTIQSTTK
jgi:biopolymer transport protein ExbB